MTKQEIAQLLRNLQVFLEKNTDCFNPSCDCEGNDYEKGLALDLLLAIDKLERE